MFNIIGQTFKAFLLNNLYPWSNLGNILLVGEGNLSFSKSLLVNPMISIETITATTYENDRSLSEETIQNAKWLKSQNITVKHGIDATKLNFKIKFDTIVFQFPNVGSRDPKYGQNPNHIMIKKFLDQSKNILSDDGKILITIVDSPYYKGAFKFDDIKGYKKPEIFPFDPRYFMGYNHTNTNDDKSALNKYHRFITYVFRPI